MATRNRGSIAFGARGFILRWGNALTSEEGTEMRVEKLEKAEAAGLRALGFSVAADGETAEIKMPDLTINIMRPWGAEEFNVLIDLPNGSALLCHARRQAITNAAE